MTFFKNYSWHVPMCINQGNHRMFNPVYPEQPGGWGETVLIMMNQQFAVYPDSSTSRSNPIPSSAEIVPPTATKIHTLNQLKTISSPLNHYSLTLSSPPFALRRVFTQFARSDFPFRGIIHPNQFACKNVTAMFHVYS